MSEQATARLREMQSRLETDAASATTYAELRRLRAYWYDLEQVIQTERLDNQTATE